METKEKVINQSSKKERYMLIPYCALPKIIILGIIACTINSIIQVNKEPDRVDNNTFVINSIMTICYLIGVTFISVGSNKRKKKESLWIYWLIIGLTLISSPLIGLLFL